jgi:hypothetical protein
MSNNRKRTADRNIQSIRCENGQMKQIKHPKTGAAPNDPWGMSKAQDFERAMKGVLSLGPHRYASHEPEINA